MKVYYLIALHLYSASIFKAAEPDIYSNVIAKYNTESECKQIEAISNKVPSKSMTEGMEIKFICIAYVR